VTTGTSRVLSGHTARVNATTFSPTGTLLATAADDATLRLWNVTTGTSRVLSGHTARVNATTFSPTGALLATAADDATLRLWDTTHGTCTAAIRTAEPLTTCLWHPSQPTVAAGGRGGTYVFHVHP
ncbi:hypothetical protein MXD63_34855, partial [Frankia sp. Cpl3]|nr:hypothetical protein [Frankia sp. Cpl3]